MNKNNQKLQKRSEPAYKLQDSTSQIKYVRKKLREISKFNNLQGILMYSRKMYIN